MKERFQTPLNNTYQDCESPFKNYNKNKKIISVSYIFHEYLTSLLALRKYKMAFNDSVLSKMDR